MNVTSCMKCSVISVYPKTTMREATSIFVKEHIGLLPVVDEDNKPVYLIGMRDMLTLNYPILLIFSRWCGLKVSYPKMDLRIDSEMGTAG